MNRNTQERFALNPTNIDIQRSRFLMTPEVKTSFNVGDLVPIGMPIEVLPGDTFEIDTAFAVRMQPLVSSPMDNLSFDYYWFFVPNRIVWNHWKEFMGENTESAWIPKTEYTIPQLTFVNGGVPKSIADYLGLPTNDQLSSSSYPAIHVSALPFRGFAMIYNEWFRNQNLVPPLHIDIDDTNRDGANLHTGNYNNVQISCALGGVLPKVSKRADYFTKALPGPQKGPDVTILDHMPVYFDGDYASSNRRVYKDSTTNLNYIDSYPLNKLGRIQVNAGTLNTKEIDWVNGSTGSTVNGTWVRNGQPFDWFVDGNLSISALRIAFQVQKLYEKDARGGTRYREMLKSHFGVTSPDASQQIPQYLGGKNVAININSVVQTSESGETPQGNIAGYSLTSHGSRSHDFIQSFTEHGYLFCVGCARIDQHTYQNGIHRSWSRKNRLDYYFPVLANISEQPILNKEIFAVGKYQTSVTPPEGYEDTDDKVFGYQEAWAEYRYMPSVCTGEMKSLSSHTLDSWHFADDYDSLPHLSESWIAEDKANVDRVLAVQSSVADQLFGDFRFNIKATRPMPMYSIPGLVDHH